MSRAGLAAIVTQIPLVDAFRWSGWYLAFHGTMQMLVVLVVFKENWSDLKRMSVNCKRLSILSGVAVPFYVSFNKTCINLHIIAIFFGIMHASPIKAKKLRTSVVNIMHKVISCIYVGFLTIHTVYCIHDSSILCYQLYVCCC